MRIDNPKIHDGLSLEATGTATGTSTLFAESSANVRNYEIPDAGDDARFLLSTNLSPAAGDIAYYDGGAWESIAAGATGQYLNSMSTGAAPQWVDKQSRLMAWTVADPATGMIPGPRLADDLSVTRLDAYTEPTGTVSFNIWERPDLISTGAALISTGTTAIPTGTSVSSFSDSSWDADDYIYLEITDVTDDPGYISVTIICE